MGGPLGPWLGGDPLKSPLKAHRRELRCSNRRGTLVIAGWAGNAPHRHAHSYQCAGPLCGKWPPGPGRPVAPIMILLVASIPEPEVPQAGGKWSLLAQLLGSWGGGACNQAGPRWRIVGHGPPRQLPRVLELDTRHFGGLGSLGGSSSLSSRT
jgi:hypothetical protein